MFVQVMVLFRNSYFCPKTTYATDLTTELPATPAASPTDNNFKVAVGNRTDLYIAGVVPFCSDVKKLSYSTDSVAAYHQL